MALALSLLDDGFEPTSNPSSTASVNPTSGSVTYLFVAYAVAGGGTTAASDTVTPSGARGTWTELDQAANDNVSSGRRAMKLFRGTGTVTNEAISITINTATGSGGTWTETAWLVIEATGQDATPDDASVVNGGIASAASLPDVGTPDTGDAVLWAVFHETSEAVAATGWTAIGAVETGSGGDIRTLHGFYDDSSPDETPATDNFTSGANTWGAIGLIVNVAAGGGGATIVNRESLRRGIGRGIMRGV